jgi:putative transposase
MDAAQARGDTQVAGACPPGIGRFANVMPPTGLCLIVDLAVMPICSNGICGTLNTGGTKANVVAGLPLNFMANALPLFSNLTVSCAVTGFRFPRGVYQPNGLARGMRPSGVHDSLGFGNPLYWKAKYAGMTVSEARRLKELEQENAKLKRLLAEAELDKAALKDLLHRKL